MKFLSFFLLCFSAAAACASDFPVTVQSCNRSVEFSAPPARAVAHDANLVEMVFALGLADRLIGYTGVSGWKTFDEKLRADIASLPELSPKYPSREVLLGAAADFFFAGWNYGMRVGGEVTPETLAELGIATYELSESCAHVMARGKASVDDLYADLRNLGRIFGVNARAEALVASYQNELAEFLRALPPLARPPRVFVYDSGTDKPFTAGRAAMPTALIEAAGGRNIMDDMAASWLEVGWEAVIARDPEFIVVVDYGDVTAGQKIDFFKSHPALGATEAARRGRFVVLDYVEATPGPRNIGAIKKLAATLHGGR